MPELPLPAAFEWTFEPWGPALHCSALAPIAPHLFTTRALPLAGAGDAGVAGWAALASSLGVGPGAVVRLRQVHGDTVVVIRAGEPARRDGPVPEADIAISDHPGLGLSVRVADCNPILVGDGRTGAIAAAHAGWRGTAVAVAVTTIRAMAASFGSTPADLVVAVGPSIGPCCYEVGLEVRDAFARAGATPRDLARWFHDRPDAAAAPIERADGLGLGASDFRLPQAAQLSGFNRRPGSAGPRVFADLWTATRDQLVAAGVPPAQVHVAGLCTACHRDLFHSYRAEGTGGRTAGAIRTAGS